MEQKPRLFIYGRKEMLVLLLLGTLVSVFAFTLGVHLGKRVVPKPETVTGETEPGHGSDPHAAAEGAEHSAHEPGTVATVDDKVPEKQAMIEQAKNVDEAADTALSQSLHNEVVRTGIKLDQTRQMDLPEKTRAETKPSARETAPLKEKAPGSATGLAPGLFSIQLASYKTEAEARGFAKEIESRGIEAFVKEVGLKGKGQWFRVYVGRFANRAGAEKQAKALQQEGKIKSYVISRAGDGE